MKFRAVMLLALCLGFGLPEAEGQDCCEVVQTGVKEVDVVTYQPVVTKKQVPVYSRIRKVVTYVPQVSYVAEPVGDCCQPVGCCAAEPIVYKRALFQRRAKRKMDRKARRQARLNVYGSSCC